MTQNKMLPPDTGTQEEGRNYMQQIKDGGEEQIQDVSSINSYKTGIMLEEEKMMLT
jgi:hypothetical protein